VIEIGKRVVDLDEGRVAFVEAGDPELPPVVLLSDAFGSSHAWRRLIPLLSPWMRVIAPDPLGSGDSEARPHADLSLAGHAATIRRLWEGLGVERAAVVGHGHGGGVAQLLALDGAVEALVLIDAIAFDAWPAPAIRTLRDRRDGLTPDQVEDAVLELVGRGMVRERLAAEDLEEYLRPFRGEDGARRFARALGAFDGWGLTGLEGRLGELEVPAFVVWGEEDAFVDAAVAERLGEALSRSSVALLPGCGHLLLEDAPETVAPLVFQWLRSRYLKTEHRHEAAGPVEVYLGRRPPGEGG
jgi:pimeloyl-ACP methyl ester carboxylesterase